MLPLSTPIATLVPSPLTATAAAPAFDTAPSVPSARLATWISFVTRFLTYASRAGFVSSGSSAVADETNATTSPVSSSDGRLEVMPFCPPAVMLTRPSCPS